MEYHRVYNELFAQSNDWIGYIKKLPQIKFLRSSENDEIKRKIDLFKKLCNKSRINYKSTERFLYSLDPLTRAISKDYTQVTIGNLTIDYAKILDKGFIGLQKDINNRISNENIKNAEKFFLKDSLEIIESIIILRDRQFQHLLKICKEESDNQYTKKLIQIFSQIPLYPARTFQEALQSILFTNSLLWLNGHYLVGLGRLDQILYPFLKKDLQSRVINLTEANDLVKEFLKTLNKYYEYKSNTLLGDTGQVIVLSGKNQNGSDVTNLLTIIFIDALKELKLPDPKIVLRVHNNTPLELWDKAFQCLEEGVGYPLFSNDEIIIDSLISFGYEMDDSYDYTTSACWEPSIQGKSLDQNNLANLNFLEPLMSLLKEAKKTKKQFKDFSSFLILYEEFLGSYIKETIKIIDKIRFEPSPLLSIFVDDCVDNGKDISFGGARYNNFGLLTVGMGNTVNALLNIKKLVFDELEINLLDIYSILTDNFRSNEALRAELLNKGLKYGMDESTVINLTNELICVVQTTLNGFNNDLGGEYKFGLSSPVYITESVDYPGSFDGRRFNEPFGVHISPLNPSGMSYTEVSNFASALHYDKAFNGGVLDIMVEKNFLKNNKNNFIDYLKISFSKGVMQMQINVLNVSTLIKARKNPELYPNLIVRVWGFSAYFKDLPNEYKDLIIKRALQYESQNHQYTTV